MDEQQVMDLIEAQGLDFILQDNQLTESKVLLLLDELGYINLDQYEEGDT